MKKSSQQSSSGVVSSNLSGRRNRNTCISTSINGLLYVLRGFERLIQDTDLKKECGLGTEKQKRPARILRIFIFLRRDFYFLTTLIVSQTCLS